MNPNDMEELKLKQGDLVEVYNDNGSTQAMAYPTPTAKRKQTFMLFAYPTGVQGNVVSAGVNEFIIPNYKQTWGNIRKIADAPEGVKHLSFKSLEYSLRIRAPISPSGARSRPCLRSRDLLRSLNSVGLRVQALRRPRPPRRLP